MFKNTNVCSLRRRPSSTSPREETKFYEQRLPEGFSLALKAMESQTGARWGVKLGFGKFAPGDALWVSWVRGVVFWQGV